MIKNSMPIFTIPKKITKGEELVVIPLREYEEFLVFKKNFEFEASSAQKKALKKARRNREKGNFLTLNDLKQKLGFTN
jgi:hypothetical protein